MSLSSKDEAKSAVTPLIRLVQGHFASQALNSIVQLGIPDILRERTMTVDEIASELSHSTNQNALFRSMRMLAAESIFNEEEVSSATLTSSIAFRLTDTGVLLRTDKADESPSLACLVRHWTEPPLWKAWSALPAYISKPNSPIKTPFEMANDGVPASEYYGQHPESLKYANEFVKFMSDGEIEAVLNAFDWSSLSGKTIVDVGGYRGDVMGAITTRFPEISRCICLDLPEVVDGAPSTPKGVELVGGDMFDPSTIPKPCDAIFLKHILCAYEDDEVVKILSSCGSALSEGGRIIVADVVLPDAGRVVTEEDKVQIYVDALLMLVGNRGERMEGKWAEVVSKAGFKVDEVTPTSSLSCDILVLSKA